MHDELTLKEAFVSHFKNYMWLNDLIQICISKEKYADDDEANVVLGRYI